MFLLMITYVRLICGSVNLSPGLHPLWRRLGESVDNESSPRMGIDTLDKHWRSAIFCVVLSCQRSKLVTARGVSYNVLPWKGCYSKKNMCCTCFYSHTLLVETEDAILVLENARIKVSLRNVRCEL